MASKDSEKIWSEAKKNIRSLIISSAKGLTVKRLRTDHYEMIGADIPFRRLGFRTLEEFLVAIPDVCILNGIGDFAMVIPVITEKNAHINDMVMKQKASKSTGRYQQPPKRCRGIYNIQNAPKVERPPPKPVNTFKFPVIPDNERKTLPPPPDYFYDMKKKNPTNKQQFQNTPQYAHHNNQQNSRNSSQNTQHSMNSPQNTQQSMNSPQNTQQSMNSPQNTQQSMNVPQNIQQNSMNLPHHTNVPENINSLKVSTSYDNPQNQIKVPQNVLPDKKEESYTAQDFQEGYDEISHKKSESYTAKDFQEGYDEISTIEQPSTSHPTGNVPDVQKNIELLNIYRRYESHEDDSDDDDEFFNELRFSVDDEDFNYISDNDIDLTTSVKNLVVRDEIPCALLESPLVEEPHISRVSKKVKEKLKILISKHPDGIWCSKLIRLYEETFKTKLDPLNFGFPSVIEMCDDLPDIFYCVRPNRTDWKIYDKTKPIPDIHTMRDFSNYMSSLPVLRDDSNTEPALPSNIVSIISSPTFNYPEDVLLPGETIKRQWLINHEKPGDYIELLIAEVYDPSKFWIHLKDPTASEALGKLMDEIQVFYMHNAKSYLLNEFSARIGLYCAAVFMNEYHRAIIIKIFDDQTMKVFYCDYGTVSQVPLRKTCFLHRNFAELPMQAVRARLANIMPKEQNTMWPRSASNLMLKLIMEKDLVGYINSIDYDQEILDLIVTDTTKPDIDIHINDVLVEEGFAVLGNEAPLTSDSNATVPNVHLYPAFEELENAIYPCLTDVITMLKLGHTYETIFHGYFTSSANSSHPHDYSNLQNSRCGTSFDEAYSRCVSIENNYITEDIPQEVCDTEENVENNTEYDDYSNVESQNISPVESETEKVQEIIDDEPILTEQTQTNIEDNQIERRIRTPPGFENHQPQNLTNYYDTRPVYPVEGFPLMKHTLPYQNYPLLNTNPYNLLLSNPLLYNQLMMSQQNEAYLRTMQQVQLVEEFQKLQQQYQVNQFVNTFAQSNTPQNVNIQPQVPQCDNSQPRSDNTYQLNSTSSENAPTTSRLDLPASNFKISDQPPSFESHSKDFRITTDLKNEAASSISNISEHICERFVLKTALQGCTLHILKINDEFYVVSQEIISSLLKYDLSWKKWLKSFNLQANAIPNKLVNIMNYEHLYNQVKRYNIPGVSPPNNLGCIVRLTLLTEVADIVEKFGNKQILPDLKEGIAYVMENADLWKVTDCSD